MKESKLASINELFDPAKIAEVIRCARSISGLDLTNVNEHTELPQHETTSKAMHIGGELRQLAHLKRGSDLSAGINTP